MTIIRIVWTFINVSYCVHESWFTLNKNNGLRIKTKLLTCDDIYSCCLYDNLSCKLFVLSLLCGKNVVPHIWMSHVSHMNESCLTYVSHMNYSCCPFCVERMLSLWYMNESCLTYEWVMSHIWMSHVLHMSHIWIIRVVPFVWKECCPSGIWMSRVSHINESCLTYVSHMNYSCCPFCAQLLSLLCVDILGSFGCTHL